MLVEFANLQEDAFVLEGFVHVADFLDPVDLQRATDCANDFYDTALERGLFYTADEAHKMGLLDAIPRARRVDRAANLMYSDFAWFLESCSFGRLVRTVGVYAGPDLDMFLPRLLVTVPVAHIPDYIQAFYLPMEGKLHGSLNRFVRDCNLRAFFFIHNPWHQDWVDMPESDLRFLTSLLPLTSRSGVQAPLYVLPTSAAVEPQSLPIPHREDTKTTTLLAGPTGERSFERRRIHAGPGDLITWTARTFHKVEENHSDRPALNLRFNFSPTGARLGLHDHGNLHRVGRSALSRLREAGPTHPRAPVFVATDRTEATTRKLARVC